MRSGPPGVGNPLDGSSLFSNNFQLLRSTAGGPPPVQGETVSKSTKTERFEDMLARLEGLVRSLESEELALEESIAAFEEGMVLSRECQRRLDAAQRKVELLERNADGAPTTRPLEPAPAGEGT